MTDSLALSLSLSLIQTVREQIHTYRKHICAHIIPTGNQVKNFEYIQNTDINNRFIHPVQCTKFFPHTQHIKSLVLSPFLSHLFFPHFLFHLLSKLRLLLRQFHCSINAIAGKTKIIISRTTSVSTPPSNTYAQVMNNFFYVFRKTKINHSINALLNHLMICVSCLCKFR